LAVASNQRFWRASLFLAGAALLGYGAQKLFEANRLGAGVAAAGTALALSLQALYWSAPESLRIRRIGSIRMPRGAPLTFLGVGFILAALLVAGAAAYSGNNLIYLVLSAMLGALLVSGFVSKLALAGLHLRLALPDHIFARQPVLARISVRNLKRWIPSFSVRLSAGKGRRKGESRGLDMEVAYFPVLAPGADVSAAIEASFARRGRYRDEGVLLETRFPFGFSVRRTRLNLSEPVVVYPAVDSSPESERIVAELERWGQGRAPGDSHDLYRVRPSTDGDEARMIHWKASARGAGLWVREFSREDHLRVRLAFDRRVPPNAPPELFEERVALCAAVVWKLFELGSEITLTSDEITLGCRPHSPEVYELMRYLGAVAGTTDENSGPRHRPQDATAEQAAVHLFD